MARLTLILYIIDMRTILYIAVVLLLVVQLWGDPHPMQVSAKPRTAEADGAPQFAIVTDNSQRWGFRRKVEVFGIPVYAVPKVEEQRLLHASHILAQYLDNDEDGVVDNPVVVDAMLDKGAFMIMWHSESDLRRIRFPDDRIGQDLGNDETRPEWHPSQGGEFDAALEEVWHLVSSAGYAYAYPDVFGEFVGSDLADAMDSARGGRFFEIPDPYPAQAWYSYDDDTCEYRCMITEYFYWAITSVLGAQQNRSDDIGREWRLHTRRLVQQRDPAIYALMTDSRYRLPTLLPDGSYRQ